MLSKRQGLTLIEMLVVICLMAIIVTVLLPATVRAHRVNTRAACQANLQQIGLACKMYANEAPGEKWPPWQAFHDGLSLSFAAAPRVNLLYPKYLSDPTLLLCPLDRDAPTAEFQHDSGMLPIRIPDYQRGSASLADTSYVYWSHPFDKAELGHGAMRIPKAVANIFECEPNALGPKQIVTAMSVLAKEFERSGNIDAFDSDLTVPEGIGVVGSNRIYRLREGIERFFITDVNSMHCGARGQSELWVLHDAVSSDSRRFHHAPGGSNVLFLDGHVEFIELDQRAPINHLVANLFENG